MASEAKRSSKRTSRLRAAFSRGHQRHADQRKNHGQDSKQAHITRYPELAFRPFAARSAPSVPRSLLCFDSADSPVGVFVHIKLTAVDRGDQLLIVGMLSPPCPIHPGHGGRSFVEPLDSDCSVFGDTVATAKKQHEVVQRPSPAARRDVLNGEKVAPPARHCGNEVWHEHKSVAAPDCDWIGAQRLPPKPHGDQSAIQQSTCVVHSITLSCCLRCRYPAPIRPMVYDGR